MAPFSSVDHGIIPDTFESINVEFIAGGNTGVTTTLFYNGLTGALTLGDSSAGINGEIDTTGGVVKSARLELTNDIKLNNNAGTSGQVLTSGGANAVPTWTTPTNLTMGSNDPASGSGGVAISNNEIIYTPPVIVPTNNPTFTGTVSTPALNVASNRNTIDTVGYVRLRSSSGAATTVAEWDSNNGNIVVATLYYTGQVFYSDDRIKSNTRDISDATATLMKLRPVQYEKHPSLIVPEGKEDTDLSNVEKFTETGFVAQEVEKIAELAYAVEESKYSNDKLKGIRTTDLISFLVKGFQEMNARVIALEEKLK